ncbi:unnamed protein product [Caenorhabditis bovis]|uniref:Uncharacterized protein n=1 Tax=Caenorhabditis bovis TaxID=2654633 RepID=A0A8S1F4V9_9PELO|nr:unnamed protein product [Caenorhabditis bovis]
MSSLVRQSLIAVALLSVAMVETAPVDGGKSTAKSVPKAAAMRKTYAAANKALRRGKRNVVVEEIPEADEEDILREQLSELSDDQLAMLADIVQNEIDRYDPTAEAYDIVEIPEYITNDAYGPRDRRSVVYDPYAQEDEPEDADAYEEVVFVPEQVLVEAALEAEAEQEAQDELDELELRERIAEIATILNERATRRMRLI